MGRLRCPYSLMSPLVLPLNGATIVLLPIGCDARFLHISLFTEVRGCLRGGPALGAACATVARKPQAAKDTHRAL